MGERRMVRLERLFREHYAPLCRSVYRLVGDVNDTVDLVQEAFLKLWSAAQPRLDDSQVGGYLHRLARNLAVDFLRKRAVRKRYAERPPSGRVIPFPVTPEQRVLEAERNRLVRAALDELSERQRTCLELRACGLSYDEIAVVINGNPESVGSTLTRALRKFRTAYERLDRRQPAGRRDAGAQ